MHFFLKSVILVTNHILGTNRAVTNRRMQVQLSSCIIIVLHFKLQLGSKISQAFSRGVAVSVISTEKNSKAT